MGIGPPPSAGPVSVVTDTCWFQFCEWRCEPGCYCTEGKLLSANGTVCVDREECPCLDLRTGQVLDPGEATAAPDGCNNWSEPLEPAQNTTPSLWVQLLWTRCF